jgi:hypothetical protein
VSGGDPYREDVSVLRERLKGLQKKHSALLTQIRNGSIALDRRYRAARVAERQHTHAQPAAILVIPIWIVGASIASIVYLGTRVIPILILALMAGVIAIAQRITRRPPDRLFDPSRYEEATAPAHLLAEHKWLDRDKEDADALDQEIDETRIFLEAQEKHASR